MTAKNYNLSDLIYLMQRLRTPDTGCPWDLAQSYQTIAPSTIEEAYEVVDAIEKQDYPHLKEELGDLLFQVIFYSQLGCEDGHFDFHGVVSDLVAKLVRRHPHVFPDGDLRAISSADDLDDETIKAQWEQIKAQERKGKGKVRLLDDVPASLPSLTRAAKLQKRAATVGFDWPDEQGPLAKVAEETQELHQALANDDADNIDEELGDLLFSVVNVARKLKRDPETLLRQANRKFEQRFGAVEQTLEGQAKDFSDVNLEEMEAIWQSVK